MFSMRIAGTDQFLDMPLSTQALYFQLGLYADDEGFVSPQKIIRMIGAKPDDLKVLISKEFVLPFDTGVIVITHWKENNYIQSDRFQKTTYTYEKSQLRVVENKYLLENTAKNIECIQDVSDVDTQDRLGKVRLEIGKDNNTAQAKDKPLREKFSKEGSEVIKAFEDVDSKNSKYYSNTTQRGAADFLVETYGLDMVLKVIKSLNITNKMEYFPVITTPAQLRDKWTALESQAQKYKAAKLSAKGKSYVAF